MKRIDRSSNEAQVAVVSRAIAAAVLAGMAFCGCAGPAPRPPGAQTQVAYQPVDTPGTERYELAPEEGSNVPVQLGDAPPEYPRALIAARIPHVAVRAKVIVDREGRVAEVRIEPAPDGYAHPSAFDDAVRAAASRWHYVPLRIRQWQDVLDSQGNVVDAQLVKDELKPFSLEYEFSFDLRDGAPVVATNPAGTH